MARMRRARRRIPLWAAVWATAGVLVLAGCTADDGGADPAPTPTATSGGEAGADATPAPTVTREPGPPTEAELATCSTLAQVLPDSTKVVQALGAGQPVDPELLDRVKQGDASLAGMAPENMQPLVADFSRIVDDLEALRAGTDTDGASLDTGQYIGAVNAFLDYCLDDVGYTGQDATPTPAP